MFTDFLEHSDVHDVDGEFFAHPKGSASHMIGARVMFHVGGHFVFSRDAKKPCLKKRCNLSPPLGCLVVTTLLYVQ